MRRSRNVHGKMEYIIISHHDACARVIGRLYCCGCWNRKIATIFLISQNPRHITSLNHHHPISIRKPRPFARPRKRTRNPLLLTSRFQSASCSFLNLASIMNNGSSFRIPSDYFLCLSMNIEHWNEM